VVSIVISLLSFVILFESSLFSWVWLNHFSILLIFSKNQLLVPKTCSIVLLVSISFISVLISIISFLLLPRDLDFFFYILKCKVIYFRSSFFLNVGVYCLSDCDKWRLGEPELTIGPFRISGVADRIVSCWGPGLAGLLSDFGCEGVRAKYRTLTGSPVRQVAVFPIMFLY